MARYTGPVCKLCRREGVKLFLKGDRCYSPKCGVLKRQSAPGEHGTSRKRQSEYGLQLREKQKARRVYGVLEKQFRKYFTMADRQKGVTGENLLQLLERRIDNVVYRLGFAESRPQARQVVLHGHVLVNGKKVNIASFLVKPGDVISIKETSRSLAQIKEMREAGASDKLIPKWLTLDAENASGKVEALPQREDVDLTLEEHLIVELYSR